MIFLGVAGNACTPIAFIWFLFERRQDPNRKSLWALAIFGVILTFVSFDQSIVKPSDVSDLINVAQANLVKHIEWGDSFVRQKNLVVEWNVRDTYRERLETANTLVTNALVQFAEMTKESDRKELADFLEFVHKELGEPPARVNTAVNRVISQRIRETKDVLVEN